MKGSIWTKKYHKRKISEFFLHVIAYGGFSLNKGIISLWNDTHTFFPINSFYNLQENLILLLGDEGKEILYWLGKINGMTGTIALIKRYGLKTNNFIDLINGASMDGWGKLELDSIVYKNNVPYEGHILCKNSTLSEIYLKNNGSNFSVDYFIKGELAGGAEPLFEKTIECVESSCIAKGDNYCHFILKILENEIEPKIFKELGINYTILIQDLIKLTLKRKSKFNILAKKNINFNNGKIYFFNIKGILILSYVFILLDYILKRKLSYKNYKKVIDLKIENDLDSIKFLIENSHGYEGVLKIIEMFGFGECIIKIMSKETLIIENRNNPFSKDYLILFGKQKKGVDYYLGNLIRLAFEFKYKCLFHFEEINCISKGQESCIFKYRVK